MTTRNVGFAILLFLLASSAVAQETSPPAAQKLARSPVALLAGYRIERQPFKGVEGGMSARIWKKGGMVLYYGEGMYDGNAVESLEARNIDWKQEQVISGRKIQCALTKSHELYISFPSKAL